MRRVRVCRYGYVLIPAPLPPAPHYPAATGGGLHAHQAHRQAAQPPVRRVATPSAHPVYVEELRAVRPELTSRWVLAGPPLP